MTRVDHPAPHLQPLYLYGALLTVYVPLIFPLANLEKNSNLSFIVLERQGKNMASHDQQQDRATDLRQSQGPSSGMGNDCRAHGKIEGSEALLRGTWESLEKCANL
ncbi:hypothetical protein Pyn_04731 [Prunus yedoensis var. nudiflora]|uniref:Uncharacterized protein n=1 Tax=Prunus yedoensis var. nudiflora TaxID=2094558 RepID=A0A314UN73_PRUYE|nr:hypothetical protein Pyn_04731 [Prunus yedoensis var. nudiflora]